MGAWMIFGECEHGFEEACEKVRKSMNNGQCE